MSNGEKEQKEKILHLVQDAIARDKEMRDQYQIGDKFRFIRDRVLALEAQIKEELSKIQIEIEKKTTQISEDDTVVYVYLYNAQGILFQTWNKMVAPQVLYEYSVNRPIYAEKSAAESYVRSRPNKAQHALLAVAIKKQDILPVSPETEQKDVNGVALIKVKEGALKINRIVSFTHQANDYVLNEAGQLVKKEEK